VAKFFVGVVPPFLAPLCFFTWEVFDDPFNSSVANVLSKVSNFLVVFFLLSDKLF